MRYFEQARQLLPNSSRIPELLAYVARRRGQWDRSESYFNEAERLDPRNVNLLTQHAITDIALRRFPEALRKLDQVLNITPDDVDTLVTRRLSHKPRATCRVLLRSSLRSTQAADDYEAVETQVYQAILERRPAQIISRLKEILAKPDPALGFYQWRTALFVRLGAGSRRRPCRRPGKLATGAPRTGTFPQRTAGQLYPDWRSRSDQYGSW